MISCFRDVVYELLHQLATFRFDLWILQCSKKYETNQKIGLILLVSVGINLYINNLHARIKWGNEHLISAFQKLSAKVCGILLTAKFSAKY